MSSHYIRHCVLESQPRSNPNTHNIYYYHPQRSCGKVMFLHMLRFCSQGEGGQADTSQLADTSPLAGRHSPGQTPTGRHPLGSVTPAPLQAHTPWQVDTPWQADTPLQADNPLAGRHPPGRQTHSPRDGHCSGRYVSYWNAFLLKMIYIFRGTVSEEYP